MARIADLDHSLHSFVLVDPDGALAAARAADAWPEPRPAVTGMPIAIKDVFDVRGWPTRANSRGTKPDPAPADAAAVGELRRRGAVILGKAQTFELAIGIPSAGDLFPPAVSPFDASRTPGGSSSGPAVAVATGMCSAALASDSAGSIRGPASFCGVVGFKPSFGAVPTTGMLPMAPSLDHAGFICDDLRTLSMVWEPWSRAVTDHRGRPRVGIPDALISAAGVERDVALGFQAAVAAMATLGWTCRTITMPDADRILDAVHVILSREFHSAWGALLDQGDDRIGPGARERLREGALIGDPRYRAALVERDRSRDEMRSVFADVDLIAMPTRPTVPPPDSAPGRRGPSPFCIPFNLSGDPSLSVPLGLDGDGLPFGLLLSSGLQRDDYLLSCARELEALLPARSPT